MGALEHYALHGRNEGRPLRPAGNVRPNNSQTLSISVVIPTYNRASIIRETLELCQEYSGSMGIEFVVIDDGSSDETAAVIDEMAERYNNIVDRSKRLVRGGRAMQFGYADFTPYTFIDWRFFNTANVSFNRNIIND